MGRLPFTLAVVLCSVWVVVGLVMVGAATDDGLGDQTVVAEVVKTPYQPPEYYAEFTVSGVEYRVPLADGERYKLFQDLAMRYPEGDPDLARVDVPVPLDPVEVAASAAVLLSGAGALAYTVVRHPRQQRVRVPATVTTALGALGSAAAAVLVLLFAEDHDDEVRDSGVLATARIVAVRDGGDVLGVRFDDHRQVTRHADVRYPGGTADEIGEQIDIRYLPGDPARAVAADSTPTASAWIPVAVVLLGLNAVVCAVLFGVLCWARRVDRSP
ncbi:hypothetical protein ACFQV2_26650 [Actinokineospora soli]|uniref:DUF3592 domain-containing protein n=1 Tax=Actinokineospora soli TaxID=1048753 RepID=A0ABW2TRP4_9PSEU